MTGWSRRAAGLGVGMVLALLAGCSGSPTHEMATSAAPSTAAGVGKVTTSPDGVQEITLQTQDDYRFTPSHFTVAPGKVRLTVTDVGKDMVHNFRFTPGKGPEPISANIPIVHPGEKQTVEFTVTKPGSYPFECTFHIPEGMVGTMTVSG